MRRGYDPERIRNRIARVSLHQHYRVIRGKHRDKPLGAAPAPSRFSDPQERYSVLYASTSVQCSAWEHLVRNRLTRRKRRRLPLSDVEGRLIVEIDSAEDLALVDLRNDGAVRIGAPPAIVHDGNHAAGRALSFRAYHDIASADGLMYSSRFLPDSTCVAVFDRAINKLEASRIVPLVRHRGFIEMLDEYEIDLIRTR